MRRVTVLVLLLACAAARGAAAVVTDGECLACSLTLLELYYIYPLDNHCTGTALISLQASIM